METVVPKPKPIDARKLTQRQLEDMGVPYFVAPDDLRVLGLDPDTYFKGFGNGAGWALDRKKDAALIERLRSMQEPHGTVQ
jgi:hypothetical protein